ncbi:ATP-binding protein [Campylobacter sp. RM16187]|uniref:ATP-binding protein n=1 Tax=Campylobacter sp. RM16187 TaxID=1660063 RepID=UPI0021B69FA2|nr:ATP-binding protein [Campylobacter sp. RM16187]QKG29812.1 archaeal ATPase family protein [Campylobacter sp. RM16187]
MFADRVKELKLLNDEYSNSNFSFTVLYGRRRVGKTTLLKEFIKDKPSIYFLATLENFNVVLNRFKDIVAEFLQDSLLKSLELTDIKQLFKYLSNKKFDKKIIIIIDEFQYLSKIDSSIPSQFQYIIDELLKDKSIHLILCGSIISMMYEQTLSYNSPLYGRRTSDIKLEAIEFDYLKEFFNNKSKEELIELYSVLYGVPKYLEMFRDSGDIFNSIETNILNPNGYLYNEPQFILQNEVNEPITYFSILEAIANGEHKIGNIAGKLNKNVQNITSFISKLMELDIIYKDVPITESNPLKSKKGLYFIKDNFFRFWFSYVLPYKSQLEIGNTNYVLNILKENFNSFISPIYEKLALRYMMNNYSLIKCGRWWDKDTEIDIVGIAQDYLIAAECKYSNKKVGIDVLKDLQEKSKKIDSNLPIKHFFIFSKSGFTDELKKLKGDEVVLVELV